MVTNLEPIPVRISFPSKRLAFPQDGVCALELAAGYCLISNFLFKQYPDSHFYDDGIKEFINWPFWSDWKRCPLGTY